MSLKKVDNDPRISGLYAFKFRSVRMFYCEDDGLKTKKREREMEKLDIDNLTVKQIKQIQSLLKSSAPEAGHPYQVGQNYFIRTVTHYYTGKLERVTAKELVLSSAAWIADTGRFHDALKTGKLNEIEPFEDEVIIGRGSLIDVTRWKHELPKAQK